MYINIFVTVKNILETPCNKSLFHKLTFLILRSENAEMDIGRLNVRIDKVEEDLIIEKGKIKQVSDELNGLFNSMMDDGY